MKTEPKAHRKRLAKRPSAMILWNFPSATYVAVAVVLFDNYAD
jgi:hypothetical protein